MQWRYSIPILSLSDSLPFTLSLFLPPQKQTCGCQSLWLDGRDLPWTRSELGQSINAELHFGLTCLTAFSNRWVQKLCVVTAIAHACTRALSHTHTPITIFHPCIPHHWRPWPLLTYPCEQWPKGLRVSYIQSLFVHGYSKAYWYYMGVFCLYV